MRAFSAATLDMFSWRETWSAPGEEEGEGEGEGEDESGDGWGRTDGGERGERGERDV